MYTICHLYAAAGDVMGRVWPVRGVYFRVQLADRDATLELSVNRRLMSLADAYVYTFTDAKATKNESRLADAAVVERTDAGRKAAAAGF